MIDDGPRFKLMLYRMIKRFELDLAVWPRPPERAGDDWSDYWQCRFEDVLFRAGLGVRKLIEAAKISIEVQGCPMDLSFAPTRGNRVPDTMNYHRVEEFYDVQNASATQLPIISVCHAIVHSYVLVPRFTYSGLDGLRLHDFFLASDKGRRHGVYLIKWRDLVENLVYPVTRDDICGLLSYRTGEGDELRIPLSTPGLSAESRQQAIELYRNLSKNHAKAVKQFTAKCQAARGLPPESSP